MATWRGNDAQPLRREPLIDEGGEREAQCERVQNGRRFACGRFVRARYENPEKFSENRRKGAPERWGDARNPIE